MQHMYRYLASRVSLFTRLARAPGTEVTFCWPSRKPRSTSRHSGSAVSSITPAIHQSQVLASALARALGHRARFGPPTHRPLHTEHAVRYSWRCGAPSHTSAIAACCWRLTRLRCAILAGLPLAAYPLPRSFASRSSAGKRAMTERT